MKGILSWELLILLGLAGCGSAPVIGTVQGKPITMRSVVLFQNELAISDVDPGALCRLQNQSVFFAASSVVSAGNVGLLIEGVNPGFPAPDAVVPRALQIRPNDPLGNNQDHAAARFIAYGSDTGLEADSGELRVDSATFRDDARTQLEALRGSLELTFGTDKVSTTFVAGSACR